MEEEISKKIKNIKNLEDKHSKEFKLKILWMEKFLESLAKSSKAQNYSLEVASLNILCKNNPLEFISSQPDLLWLKETYAP